MPGGIDPHTHLEMPFMGTYSADDFESRAPAPRWRAAPPWSSISRCPSPGQGLLDAIKMWDNKSTRANCDYSFHMAITWWGEQVFNEMKDGGDRAGHQHLQALHGLQGRADGRTTTRCSPRSAAAPNWARSRWCMPRTATSSPTLQQQADGRGQ
jgi:dihydroorotase-like cyclic amidohydrolase